MTDGMAFAMVALTFFNTAVGWAIGNAKGRPTAGLLWGMCLGWIGWLVIGCGKNHKYKCPYCQGLLPMSCAGLRRCQHCGVKFDGTGEY